MINKKRKGFTIVELVIVIAIIAILAAVLIPTFASIIRKANESADIQAVRQMNVALAAESVESKPTDIATVILILGEAGYNAEDKLIPVSKDHGFYWYKNFNTILLVKDEEGETPELIYPTDNNQLVDGFVTAAGDKTLTEAEGFYDLGENTVALTYNALEAAIATGESIVLTENMTIDKPLSFPAGKSATIDLGGHSLTLKATISVYGYLTIKGADQANSISVAPEGASLTTATMFSVQNGGTLALDTLTMTVGSANTGIHNSGAVALNDAKLTVSGENSVGIENNGGTVVGTDSDVSTSGGATGVINNTGGTVTLDGTNVIADGGATGIDNNGTLNVNCTAGTSVSDAITFPEATNSSTITANGSDAYGIKHSGGTAALANVSVSASDGAHGLHNDGTMYLNNDENSSMEADSGKDSLAIYNGENGNAFLRGIKLTFDPTADDNNRNGINNLGNMSFHGTNTVKGYSINFDGSVSIADGGSLDISFSVVVLADGIKINGNLTIKDATINGTEALLSSIIAASGDNFKITNCSFEIVGGSTVGLAKDENGTKLTGGTVNLGTITSIDGILTVKDAAITGTLSTILSSANLTLENCTYGESMTVSKDGTTVTLRLDAATTISDLVIPKDVTVTLNLNGQTLTLGATAITVNNGGELSVVNTAETEATINATATNSFVVNSGKLNLGTDDSEITVKVSVAGDDGIFAEEGAIVDIGNNCSFVYEPEGEKYTLTTKGEEITATLRDDVTLTETTAITKTVTINLDGHTLKMNDGTSFNVDGGSLEISGSGDVTGTVDQLNSFLTSTDLTLDGCTFNGMTVTEGDTASIELNEKSLALADLTVNLTITGPGSVNTTSYNGAASIKDATITNITDMAGIINTALGGSITYTECKFGNDLTAPIDGTAVTLGSAATLSGNVTGKTVSISGETLTIGAVTVDSGTLAITGDGAISGDLGSIIAASNVTITSRSFKYTVDSNEYTVTLAKDASGTSIKLSGATAIGNLNVSSGNAEIDLGGYTLTATSISNSGSLRITNGTVSIDAGEDVTAVSNSGTLEISALNVTANAEGAYGIYNNGGTAKITTATLSADTDETIGTLIYVKSGTVEIASGSVTATAGAYAAYGQTAIAPIVNSGTLRLGVNGGDVDITSNKYCTNTWGGTLTISKTSELTYGEGCGYNSCSNSNNDSGCKSINDCEHFEYRGSLEEQFEELCANGGGTLVFNENTAFTTATTIPSGVEVTLDLADFTLDLSGANLSIEGMLKIKGGTLDTGDANPFNVNGGTLYLDEGLTVESTVTLLNYIIANSNNIYADFNSSDSFTLVTDGSKTVMTVTRSGTSTSGDFVIPDGKMLTLEITANAYLDLQNARLTVNKGGVLNIQGGGKISVGAGNPFAVADEGQINISNIHVYTSNSALLNDFIASNYISFTDCIFEYEYSDSASYNAYKITLSNNGGETTVAIESYSTRFDSIFIIPSGKTVTIDLNGKTINLYPGSGFLIKDKGVLNIVANSGYSNKIIATANATDIFTVESGGVLNIGGGAAKIVLETTETTSNGTYFINNKAGGTVTIQKCDLVAQGASNMVLLRNDGNATVDGCNIIYQISAAGEALAPIHNYGTLLISGTTRMTSCSTNKSCIFVGNSTAETSLGSEVKLPSYNASFSKCGHIYAPNGIDETKHTWDGGTLVFKPDASITADRLTDGETFTLDGPYYILDNLSIDRITAIIDLNGNTLTINKDVALSVANGTLTIIDSVGGGVIYVNGSSDPFGENVAVGSDANVITVAVSDEDLLVDLIMSDYFTNCIFAFDKFVIEKTSSGFVVDITDNVAIKGEITSNVEINVPARMSLDLTEAIFKGNLTLIGEGNVSMRNTTFANTTKMSASGVTIVGIEELLPYLFNTSTVELNCKFNYKNVTDGFTYTLDLAKTEGEATIINLCEGGAAFDSKVEISSAVIINLSGKELKLTNITAKFIIENGGSLTINGDSENSVLNISSVYGYVFEVGAGGKLSLCGAETNSLTIKCGVAPTQRCFNIKDGEDKSAVSITYCDFINDTFKMSIADDRSDISVTLLKGAQLSGAFSIPEDTTLKIKVDKYTLDITHATLTIEGALVITGNESNNVFTGTLNAIGNSFSVGESGNVAISVATIEGDKALLEKLIAATNVTVSSCNFSNEADEYTYTVTLAKTATGATITVNGTFVLDFVIRGALTINGNGTVDMSNLSIGDLGSLNISEVTVRATEALFVKFITSKKVTADCGFTFENGAVKVVKSGTTATVTLTEDTTFTDYITVSDDETLNIVVPTGKTLTVKDFRVHGTLTVNGGGTVIETYDYPSVFSLMETDSTVTIENIKLITDDIGVIQSLMNDENVTLTNVTFDVGEHTISGSTSLLCELINSGVSFKNFQITSGETVVGTIEVTRDGDNVTIKIVSGTLDLSSLVLTVSGNLTIKGGTLTANENSFDVGGTISINETTLNGTVKLLEKIIEDSEITVGSCNFTFLGKTVTLIKNSNGTTISTTGDLDVSASTIIIEINGNLTVNVDGTLKASANSFDRQSGSLTVTATKIDGSEALMFYLVNNATVNGEMYFNDCTATLSTADGVTTINLSELTVLSGTHNIAVKVVIDLNGNTLMLNAAKFNITTGSLTINGGTVVIGANSDVFSAGASVTLNNVAIETGVENDFRAILNYFINNDNVRLDGCSIKHGPYTTLNVSKENADNTVVTLTNDTTTFSASTDFEIGEGKTLEINLNGKTLRIAANTKFNISGQLNFTGTGKLYVHSNISMSNDRFGCFNGSYDIPKDNSITVYHTHFST